MLERSMQNRPLGRTGLRVAEIGLGGVWFAARDRMPDYARVIHRALDLGVDLIDTAPGYKDSEEVVGEALSGGRRERVILSSKYYPYRDDGKVNLSGEALARSLARSLTRLKCDYLDILHLHWVQKAGDVMAILDSDLARTLQRFKTMGHIRHIAISEASELDGDHAMLAAALPAGLFDVVMVTYNVFLQTAEREIFRLCRETDTGVLVMMPLNQPMGAMGLVSGEFAAASLRNMIKEGALPDAPPYTDPGLMDFLTAGSDLTLPQAAVRFCLDRPEPSCVLIGTSSVAHLEENLAAATAPPLSPAVHARARELFGRVSKQVK